MRTAPYAIAALLLTTLSVAACGNADPPTNENTAARFDPIIGGTLDNDSSHDGVVLLFNQSGGGMCTGAIISQSGQKGVVLTARHCVSETVHEYVTCQNDVAGDHNPSSIYVLKGTSPTGQQDMIGTGEKLFHAGGVSLCDADIAVMVMSQTVSGVQPLRVRIDSNAYQIGETFTAIGYGLTNPNNDYTAGRRYIREDVSVTDLGPKYYGLYEREFLGTTSICSGDSGGPAISAQYAVMGVTSRGGDCYGSDNIWTRPDGFKDLLDDAMIYANSMYMDEDGALHDGTGTVGTGGSGGTGGAGGTGGTGAAAGMGGSGGEGGEDSGVGGTGGDATEPSCGDLGPCPPGATCVIDPNTGEHACGMTCNESIACPEGAVCSPELGVCVQAGSSTNNDDTGSDGSCSVSRPKGQGGTGAAAGLLLLMGTALLRRRRS